MERSRVIRLRVKEIAAQKGMSQGLVSRLSNIDHNTIREIFRDPTRNITLDTLNRLAHGLKVHPCELIEFVPD
jgi:DNA-binding Xre family transcriptional regulator